jgi:hypothetical protein
VRTWNVRSLCRGGSLKTLAREVTKYKYKLDLVTVQDVIWDNVALN